MNPLYTALTIEVAVTWFIRPISVCIVTRPIVVLSRSRLTYVTEAWRWCEGAFARRAGRVVSGTISDLSPIAKVRLLLLG
jgi:hypothetical protein